jgi:hydrogenase nickel incorporation protein HypA/HybF
VHELSLASAVVSTAERHADGRRVTVVKLRVGRLRQVVPDTLRFCFELAARDTACHGARLEIEAVEVGLRCTACGHDWHVEIPSFRCPACAGAQVEVTTGDELEVESIDVEEGACIAPG